MNQEYSVTPIVLQDIENTLSIPRLRRYVVFATGDIQKAIRLYRWNCWLSQTLVWPLHMLEIATRNSVSAALTHKFGARWLFSPTFRSGLDLHLRQRLQDAYDRQCAQRRTSTPLMDQIIADLSMGTWTALLAGRYEVPFGWATRIKIAFPHMPALAGRADVSSALDELRDLRNRVAHYEPILHLNLADKYEKILILLKWKSPNILWHVQETCRFHLVLGRRPTM